MILFVIGTKAQYIKLAPVLVEARRQHLPHRVLYTGQHCETFADLQANLGLSDPDQVLVPGDEATDRVSFAHWLWRAVHRVRRGALEGLLEGVRVVVVHGDTASALLGAWIGTRSGIPVAHVEAGLRSFSYRHPFPEELMRVLVARRTTLHFCPDATAVANLALMGVAGERIDTGGNTLRDAVRLARAAHAPGLDSERYALFSMHRHENLFDRKRLDFLLGVLRDMARRIPVRFVLHPVTVARLARLGLIESLRAQPGLTLVPRLDFFAFIGLLAQASFIASDGGSNQEESAMLGIPCLLLRQATERLDGLGGSAVLSNYDAGTIQAFVAQHAGRTPAVREVEGPSPSAIVVSHLGAY